MFCFVLFVFICYLLFFKQVQSLPTVQQNNPIKYLFSYFFISLTNYYKCLSTWTTRISNVDNPTMIMMAMHPCTPPHSVHHDHPLLITTTSWTTHHQHQWCDHNHLMMMSIDDAATTTATWMTQQQHQWCNHNHVTTTSMDDMAMTRNCPCQLTMMPPAPAWQQQQWWWQHNLHLHLHLHLWLHDDGDDNGSSMTRMAMMAGWRWCHANGKMMMTTKAFACTCTCGCMTTLPAQQQGDEVAATTVLAWQRCQWCHAMARWQQQWQCQHDKDNEDRWWQDDGNDDDDVMPWQDNNNNNTSGKTNNAIDHYLSLYIAIGHYLCNKCTNRIMADRKSVV